MLDIIIVTLCTITLHYILFKNVQPYLLLQIGNIGEYHDNNHSHMSMCFTYVSVSYCHLDICVNPAWAGWLAARQWVKVSYKRAAFLSFIFHWHGFWGSLRIFFVFYYSAVGFAPQNPARFITLYIKHKEQAPTATEARLWASQVQSQSTYRAMWVCV